MSQTNETQASETDDTLPDIDGAHPPRLTRALIGHETAIDELCSASSSRRLHHAWLLAGPKGVGKASFAYLCARALLRDGFEGILSNFATATTTQDGHLIEQDAHPDLFILKRRFNPSTSKFRTEIPVDATRKLKSRFVLTAARSGWRVAIIDSIDEMNKNGVNGLLKLLEEPPEKTLVLIICHHPGRLLDTIKSRCRTLHFQPLTDIQLAGLISTRTDDMADGIDANQAAAAAFLADGSAGRAIDLAIFGGMDIYRDMVDVLGALPNMNIERLHAFADRFGPRITPERFEVFCYLFSDWLYRVTRNAVSASNYQPVFEGEAELVARLQQQMSLEQACRLWEKVNRQMGEVSALNLDRKQAVLGWFEGLAELMKPDRKMG